MARWLEGIDLQNHHNAKHLPSSMYVWNYIQFNLTYPKKSTETPSLTDSSSTISLHHFTYQTSKIHSLQ